MHFEPVTILSKSVPKTLKEFSQEERIDINLIDFDLLSVETFISGPPDDEYVHITEVQSILSDTLLNPKVSMIQKYGIRLFPLEDKQNSLKLVLNVNELKTKADISILEGTILSASKDFLQKLKKEIWKKKLRAGLLIDIFEDSLDSTLKKLLNAVPSDRPIQRGIKFNVANAIDITEPMDEKVIKYYEQKYQNSHSIIKGVNTNELIMKYYKPVEGKPGRACDGSFVKAKSPKTLNIKPIFDETITQKDFFSYIEYYANIDGYVKYVNGKYSILQTLTLQEANFKNSRAIQTGIDKDISLHINSSKTSDHDTIGSGVEIEVKNLNVNGAIGSNVRIVAQELNIDAQTHKNSAINVEGTANIKHHRGDLSAYEAIIDVLEIGKVVAKKSIHIKKMLGGEAIAPEVVIDNLLSNCIIKASKSITIKNFMGKNVQLIIDPHAIQSYHQDIQSLQEKISESTKSLRTEHETFAQALTKHVEEAERMKVFKNRVLQAEKNGGTPMKQDLIKIKMYKYASQEFKKQNILLTEEQSRIDLLQMELEKMYQYDLYAKITCQSTYDGHSKVIFVNPKNQEEVSYIPNGIIETISLTLDPDGQRVIQTN